MVAMVVRIVMFYWIYNINSILMSIALFWVTALLNVVSAKEITSVLYVNVLTNNNTYRIQKVISLHFFTDP